MNNELADRIKTYLDTKHTRVYRNKSVKTPTYPYVVYILNSASDSYPTTDYRLVINIVEKNDGTVSIRTAEDLADAIHAGLNTKVLSSTNYKTHLTLDSRQFDDDDSLSGVQIINMQYTIRVY